MQKESMPMDKGAINTSIKVFWACIFILALMFSMPAVSATTNVSPTPGTYCPGKNVLLIKAEELSNNTANNDCGDCVELGGI